MQRTVLLLLALLFALGLGRATVPSADAYLEASIPPGWQGAYCDAALPGASAMGAWASQGRCCFGYINHPGAWIVTIYRTIENRIDLSVSRSRVIEVPPTPRGAPMAVIHVAFD